MKSGKFFIWAMITWLQIIKFYGNNAGINYHYYGFKFKQIDTATIYDLSNAENMDFMTLSVLNAVCVPNFIFPTNCAVE